MCERACRRQFMYPIWPVGIAFLVSTVGCDGPDLTAESVVTDSAGVRVVNYGSVSTKLSSWHLSEDPRYRVGWSPGQLEFGRVVAGVLLSDGRAVVADANPNRVLVFSPHGELQLQFGEEGEGPGEFNSIRTVTWIGGDTLMVEDDGAFRFTAFFKGEFVRQIGLPMQELRATRMYALDALGATTEGDILLAGRPSAVSSSADAWGRAALVVMDRFGERFDTVAMYDAVPPASLEWGSFRPLGSVAVTGDRIVLARNDRPEVRWLDFEGELRQITRWNDDPVPLTEAFRAEYREFLLEQSTADEVDEAIRALEGPLRYFTNVIGDREGNVWLRSYESLYRDPGRYLVISAEGDWIGSVRIPRGFKILDIGSDRILVMERNEVDVGAVAVYDLVKSQVESER